MRILRKYSFVALLAARSNLAYLSEVASRILFLAVIMYVFTRLWHVTYSATGATTLGGLTLCEMIWYLTITESITMSAPRVTQQVDQDVRSGAVVVQLLRPVSYPLYSLFSNLGERAVRFILYLAVGSVITCTLAGPPALSAPSLVMLATALPLAFVVDFLGAFLVGLGAFWLEDTNGLWLIHSRLTMLLGGMLLPIELYPHWLQQVIEVLPFACVVYGPAHLFVQPDSCELAGLLLRQVGSAAVLAAAVAGVYSLAMRRVVINGG